MARVSNFQVGAEYAKGGLVSEPPLSSPALKPVGGNQGQGLHAPGTPKTPATTAPNTPMSCFASPFMRQISGDSVWTDSFQLDDFEKIDEEEYPDELICEEQPEAKKAEDVADDQIEKDGIMWTVTRGAAPSMSHLEASLAEVKALYKAEYDEDVDNEAVEKDGVMWTMTRGAAPSMSRLEASLAEVKKLYKKKYDEAVDEE